MTPQNQIFSRVSQVGKGSTKVTPPICESLHYHLPIGDQVRAKFIILSGIERGLIFAHRFSRYYCRFKRHWDSDDKSCNESPNCGLEGTNEGPVMVTRMI